MKQPKEKFLVGIDPDVDKSGVAFLNGNQLKLDNLAFFQLFDYFKELKELHPDLEVYVELGSLNKSNWHSKTDKSSKWNSNIGAALGRNFETANKIVEMCEYLKITHHKIQPKKSKITNDYFKKLTGYDGRTNQEQRDAFMLIFGR
ncbi:hypothetical protein [Flavobacterium sp. CF136]|uniref:hypothetical protein n=1 Tax=Flavobacterium sp. (strain CF136) TaxID=1144313 RepID=UPI0002719EF8|nr:hypothetical protein [Flavobacterium sp. CF136]EJL66278.1 hypothetical protein PMI10_00626 [Flavobacterium sp. CF136]